MISKLPWCIPNCYNKATECYALIMIRQWKNALIEFLHLAFSHQKYKHKTRLFSYIVGAWGACFATNQHVRTMQSSRLLRDLSGILLHLFGRSNRADVFFAYAFRRECLLPSAESSWIGRMECRRQFFARVFYGHGAYTEWSKWH